MVVLALLAAYALGSVVFTCAFLTAAGARRRGHAMTAVLLSALLFPATWALWYLQDTRPLRIAGRTINA